MSPIVRLIFNRFLIQIAYIQSTNGSAYKCLNSSKSLLSCIQQMFQLISSLSVSLWLSIFLSPLYPHLSSCSPLWLLSVPTSMFLFPTLVSVFVCLFLCNCISLWTFFSLDLYLYLALSLPPSQALSLSHSLSLSLSLSLSHTHTHTHRKVTRGTLNPPLTESVWRVGPLPELLVHLYGGTFCFFALSPFLWLSPLIEHPSMIYMQDTAGNETE